MMYFETFKKIQEYASAYPGLLEDLTKQDLEDFTKILSDDNCKGSAKKPFIPFEMLDSTKTAETRIKSKVSAVYKA